MSGVQSGTRLDRLEQLQRATRLQRAYARWRDDQDEHDRLDSLVRVIQAEIATEQARLDAAARARPTIAAAVRTADLSVQDRLVRLGVDARTVKQWAVAQGLLPAVVRGRVSGALVTAYAHAHQLHQETP